MRDVAGQLRKADQALLVGHYLLEGGHRQEAGRQAYLAAFHAALAYIIARTGREPRTHKGAHTEFARLLHESRELQPGYPPFLSRAYVWKAAADYDAEALVSLTDEAVALEYAAGMLAEVKRAVVPVANSPP